MTATAARVGLSGLGQDVGRVIVGVGADGELTSRIVIEMIEPEESSD